MRLIFRLALALLVALEAQHALAQLTDVQTGAMVAGGALAGAGIAAQLATGSKISVKVEVFQDTIPLPATPGSTGGYRTRERTAPFYASTPLAANSLKRQLAAPGFEDAGQLIDIRDRLRQPLKRITSQAQAIAENRGAFADFQTKTNSEDEFSALNADFENLIRLFTEVDYAWGNFDRRMDGALRNGVVDDEELSVLRDRLSKVRQALERSTEYTVSRQYISLLVKDIARATLNDQMVRLATSSLSTEQEDVVFQATEDAKDRAVIQSAFPEQMAAIAWTVQPIIATLGGHTSYLDEVFARWGMLTTPQRLAVLASKDEVFREFGEQDAGSRAVALINQARSAYTLTFSQTTANTSLGPIANDVLQSVLTENGFIDEIVSKDTKRRWKPFTASSSKARTGNSNTVIYLENLATPVLKTAQFDPSAFVRANGKMYQNAWGSAAAMFGLPTATPGENGATASGHPLDRYNADSLRKQRRAVQKNQHEAQTALLRALGQIVVAAEAGTGGAELLKGIAASLGGTTEDSAD